MKTFIHRNRTQAGKAVVGVLLVLAMLVAPVAVQASWGLPGGGGLPPVDDGMGPGGGIDPLTPPRAPVDAQKCMDDLLQNYARCKLIHCTWLFWIAIDCDEPALAYCNTAAQTTYHCCMFGCGPSL